MNCQTEKCHFIYELKEEEEVLLINGTHSLDIGMSNSDKNEGELIAF